MAAKDRVPDNIAYDHLKKLFEKINQLINDGEELCSLNQ